MSESKDPYGTPPDPSWGAPGPQGPSPYGTPPYGGQPPYPPQAYGGRPPMPPDQERLWGGMAHWSALVASLLGGLAFLGPLLVLLIKGGDSPWVRRNAVESLNFQLSILIYGLVSGVLILVLVGILLLVVVGIAWLVLTIVGSVKASGGQEYRYPLTIRLVS